MAVVCAACGTQAVLDARFCERCGTPLALDSLRAGGAAPEPAPAAALASAPPPLETAGRGRSASITALGAVTAIMGILLGLAGLGLVLLSLIGWNGGWGILVLLVGGPVLLLGGAKTAAGIGLVKRRRWARGFVLFLGAVSGLTALSALAWSAFAMNGKAGAALSGWPGLLSSGGYCAWTLIALLGARGKAEFSGR